MNDEIQRQDNNRIKYMQDHFQQILNGKLNNLIHLSASQQYPMDAM